MVFPFQDAFVKFGQTLKLESVLRGEVSSSSAAPVNKTLVCFKLPEFRVMRSSWFLRLFYKKMIRILFFYQTCFSYH